MQLFSCKPLARCCQAVAVAALLGTPVLVTAGEPDEAPLDKYRVLDWRDLVPDGWEPPLVEKAYDDTAAATVDAAAVVSSLDKQLAAIPGYMRPVVFDGKTVFEFLLVPYLPQHINGHAHLDANQMVYVVALEPIVVENPYAPVWVVGAMSTESAMTDEGPAAYRLTEAIATNYE